MSGRTFSGPELAARAWYYLSPFPTERAIAGRRFREMQRHVGDAELVLQTIGELALEGYHAKAINERLVRERSSRIARALPADAEMASRVAQVLAPLVRAWRMT